MLLKSILIILSEPFSLTTSGTSYYYLLTHRLLYSDSSKYVLNAHGDVVALLDAAGSVTKRYDYDAFGNELNIDSADTNPFRYCAEYFDKEYGQIYLRNRYYLPVVGRFTQLDPIKDGLNWYAYCGNNPVVFVDPLGLYYIVDDGDGIYRLIQDNIITKLASSFLPSYCVERFEKEFGVIGGTSATTDMDVYGGLTLDIAFEVSEGLFESFKQYSNILSLGLGAFSYISNEIDTEIEGVVFDLLNRNNYSLMSNSKDHLSVLMDKSIEFVNENREYYLKKEIGINITYYEMHQNIRRSKSPDKLIKKYTKEYRQNLQNYYTPYDRDILANTFKLKLKEYQGYLNYYDSIFSNVVNS